MLNANSILFKILCIILFSAVYFLFAKLGFYFILAGINISALWLPAAIALIGLFFTERWIWPGIFLGSFLANLSSGLPMSTSILFSVASVAGPILGFELLRRKKEFRTDFFRIKDVFNFIFCAVIPGPILSASLAVLSLKILNQINTSQTLHHFATWFIGDALGILILFPLVLVIHSSKWQKLSFLLMTEAILIISVFAWIATQVITSNNLIAFIIFPFIVWSAIRFRQLGVVIMVAILATITIPIFILENQNESAVFLLQRLQFYLSSVSLTGLFLAAYINERKQIEEDLKEAVENSRKAAIIKSRFLDMAAHELRTPVTSFSLIIQLAQKQLQKGIPVDESVLQRLHYQAQHISKLVVDLLDVSRLERGKLQLNLATTDLLNVINSCIDDFKLRNPHRTVIFKNSNGPIFVNIDVTRINQVIANLLNNAAKFSPVNSSLEIVVEQHPQSVQFSLIDHGQGIPSELQHDLFTPFSKISTQLSQSGGLGLGLYICHEIIQLHQGEIGVESKTGEGSKFYFRLQRINP